MLFVAEIPRIQENLDLPDLNLFLLQMTLLLLLLLLLVVVVIVVLSESNII